VFLPFVAILFIYAKIEDYRYQKYWNTKWDIKLYECLIWSKFLKEKPKKKPKLDKTKKRLNIFKKILIVGVWFIAILLIVAIIYTLCK